MLKDIVKIFYKSDFTIQWELPEGYDGQDFRFTLFTNDDIEDGWTASYIDGTYKHCLVEDDRVTIYVDANHDMKAGCLTVQSEYDLGNNHFADGTETIKDRVKTNIYLVSIGANGTSATFIASNRADLTGSGDFVTFSDLEAMSYITSNELSQMSYVTISDLGDYLTQEEIEDMGFLTQAQLDAMGYATTDYIDSKDYATSAQVAMKQNLLVSGRNIKTVNGYSLLGQGNITIESGSEGEYNVIEVIEVNGEPQPIDNKTVDIFVPTYVSDLTNDTGFITESALGEMVTYSYLETAISDFVTSEDLVDEGYVTDEDVQQMMTNAGYVTSSDLTGFVTDTELSNAGYLTSVPSEYITESEIASMGYITETELSNVLSTASYVTSNELSNAGYITNSTLSQASYVTQQGLSAMGYITQTSLSGMGYATTTQLNSKQDTLVSGTNIKTVNGSSLLGSGDLTITGGSSISEVTQAQYDAMEQAGTLDPNTIYVITDAQSVDLGNYVTKTELSNMSYATTTQLNAKQDTLVSGTNIKTINNESILGTGNINITGGGGTADYSHVLTFTAEQANSTIKFKREGTSTSLNNAVLQYSTDNGDTWNEYTLDTTITLAATGDTVKFKGTNNALAISPGYSLSNYHRFVMTGKISATGDVTSLLNETGRDYKLQNYALIGLFYECTALTKAPNLPSTTISGYCYGYMFYGCTSLTTAPSLPATTLFGSCYIAMFQNCTSLKEAPELPATTLGYACYQGMFQYCTSLKEAPELPATTLTQSCYGAMFWGCTSLAKAPDILPATTLTSDCYASMFRQCTSLIKAPILPATTLNTGSYNYMFYGCTHLNYIKTMMTTNVYSDVQNTNIREWLYNVSSTGTFVKSSSNPYTGSWGIPANWTIYKAISIDTDDLPESYVEDNGKGLQVVNGAWEKVSGLLTSGNFIYDSTNNTLTISI